MACNTFSKFYYGYEFTNLNNKINFSEGASELLAEITPGIYSPSSLTIEIKTQFDAAGAKTYTVSFDRDTRKFTIAADSGTYELLISTGSYASSAPWDLLGFTGSSDLTGSISYESDSASGYEYSVQFKLQDYTAPTEWYEKLDASVNESASGDIEIVSFGTIQFTEFNLMFITDLEMGNSHIRTNTSGVSDANSFMQFLIKRGKFDFMPDEDTTSTYYVLTLESTRESGKGVAYKLKEETGKNLPGIYQTGKLKFRVSS